MDNSVKKFRASDGDLLGTFPAGPYPTSLAFDGTNVWVANCQVNGSITKLRASDGAMLGTYPAGVQPTAIQFDGVHIWVANPGTNSVRKM